MVPLGQEKSLFQPQVFNIPSTFMLMMGLQLKLMVQLYLTNISHKSSEINSLIHLLLLNNQLKLITIKELGMLP